VEDEQSLEDSRFVRAAIITPRRASTSRATAPRRPMRGICSALSNRELQLLERPVRHRKQTEPVLSNRELSTNHCRNNSRTPPLLQRQIYNWSRPLLTGSASQTECDVTHSKQTTGKFLTGARTHIRVFRFSPLSIARKPQNQTPTRETSPAPPIGVLRSSMLPCCQRYRPAISDVSGARVGKR
jgi:hypothetical protein